MTPKQELNDENKLIKNAGLATELVLKEDKKLFEELGKERKENICCEGCYRIGKEDMKQEILKKIEKHFGEWCSKEWLKREIENDNKTDTTKNNRL